MTFVFFITDCLFALVMLVVWELHWILALSFFIFFGALDGVYLSATLNKVLFLLTYDLPPTMLGDTSVAFLQSPRSCF